ncbi:hypothetical protein [Sphingomonas sp. ABOLE]|uniref:hypothetical protein n=1 Tax=Sphingomonas sp. ABOLE TaxID=1985878 RepID=UPI0013DF68F6|nr:hypothetical protein [Sphingomonas sp. ABOLE]
MKEDALDRLRRHIAAGSFVYFPAWEDGKANVIGAVVEADDTPAYAARLGYPLALADMLPMFVNSFRPQAEAERFAEVWLERTPVGADLTKVVSHLVLDLLANAELATLIAGHPEAEEGRQAIMALHRRAIDGDEPDRKTWKAARLAAVTATDAVAEGTLERRAAQVVEAAAWPGTMRTVLRDTLNALGTAELQLSLSRVGWTEEDESRVFHIRKQAETDGYKAEFEGLARVLAILDADHPALAEQFRVRLELVEESGARSRAVAWQAVEMMEQAPIAARMSV